MGNTLGAAALGAGAALAPALIGGPAGILLGGAFAIAAGLLFRPKRDDASQPNVQAPKGNPNRPLPIVFGTDAPQDVGVDFFGNVRYIEQEESTKGSQNVTTGFQVLADLGCSVCRGQGQILKIWREGALVYDAEGTGPIQALTGTLRLYPGSVDQTPDPVEQALFGIERTPAYLDVVRFTIQNHDISDLNRMPIFKALVTRTPTPVYPADTIDIDIDGRTSTTSLDGQNLIYAESDDTITTLNIESQTVVSSEASPTGFADLHNTWQAVDFDNNVYVAKAGIVLNTSVVRLYAPDYQTLDQSPDRSTGGGYHFIISNLPIAVTRSEQVLFAMAGLNVNAWRLEVGGFPNNFSIDNLNLEGSTGINRDLQGPAAAARDPLTGEVWFFASHASPASSFYAAIFDVVSVAFIQGANGSLEYNYDEAGNDPNVLSACYVPQTHEMAVLAGQNGDNTQGLIYFIDVDTRQLVDKMSFGQNIEIANIGYTTFSNGPDESGRIFVHPTDTDSRNWLEVDLVQRQIINAYDLSNWGVPTLSTNNGAARYDETRRALWVDTQGDVTIVYLDRFSGTGVNLAEVTAELIDDTGELESALDFDGTAIEPITIRGAVYNENVAASFLQELYNAHNARLIDSGWKLKGIRRGGVPVFAIQSKHLGAAEGDSAAPTISRPRTSPLSLPQRVEIAFRQPSNYQNGTEGHPRALDAVVSRDATVLSYPGVLSADEAKSICMQQIDLAYLEAQSYDTSVPPEFINIEPGDVGTIEDGNELVTVEVIRPSLGANSVVDLKTVRIDDRALSRAGTGAPSIIPDPIIQPIVSTTPVILDTPLLLDQLEGVTPVIQIAGLQNSDNPRGATIQRSPNGIDGWVDYAAIDPSKIIQSGILKSALPAGSVDIFDRTNTIHVDIVRGSLASAASEEAIINDDQLNAYIIPTDNPHTWQIGQFTNATLQGDGSYILDTLVRARRDNENHLTSAQGKPIYFPTIPSLLAKAIPLSEVGTTFFYRAITFGQNRPGPVVGYTILGQSKIPYLGVDPNGSLVGNDWNVDWMSRSRLGPAFGLNAPPIAEAIFDFRCYMLDGPQGNPIANAVIGTTATPNGSAITTDQTSTRRQTMVITEQDQIEWFGSVQVTIHLRIHQLSDIVGEGWPLYVSFS